MGQRRGGWLRRERRSGIGRKRFGNAGTDRRARPGPFGVPPVAALAVLDVVLEYPLRMSAGNLPYDVHMPELVFEVVQEADGGYCAECLTENIFTEGDTWEALRKNVVEATAAFFFDRPRPERIRLRLVRDETLSVA
jgi:hypothetical protein